MATTWDISFQAVQEDSAPAADLLRLFSYLAPDDIPRYILIEGAQHLPKSLESVVADQIALDDAVVALRRYSLIAASGDMFSIHRLVQAVTQDMLPEDLQKVWAETALRLVDSAFPFDSDDVRTWERCSLLLSHALVAAKHAELLGVTPKVVGHLLNQVGLYLTRLAEFQEAKKCFERALKIGEKVYGPDHTNVAIRVNNLGLVLKDLGDLQEAKKCFERALKICRARLGEDHPHTKLVLENLKSLQPRK